MATLKLKSSIVRVDHLPATAPKRSRTAKVLDFADHKPAAHTARQRSRSEKPNFEALFGFKPSTTGEHISILRAFMHLEGMPAIPETMKIADFANIFARYVLPRREWPFFTSGREHAARDFVKQWSSALLPQIVNKRKAKKQPWLHDKMVPELAALYNPVYFGLAVQS